MQQSKEKFIQKETEEKIREFIKGLLEIPVKTDPTDKNAWQLSLYRKIGNLLNIRNSVQTTFIQERVKCAAKTKCHKML